MTAFRRTTPEVEAAQFTPTTEQPLTFTDQPEWLTKAIEVGRLTARTNPEGAAYLVLQAHHGAELVAPTDWIIQDRWGHIYSLGNASFVLDFEEFPAEAAAAPTATPTTTPAPAVAGATK